MSSRIYYGWVIVAGLALVGAVSAGMGGVNLGLFVDPMSEELGVGKAAFGWAQTARLVGFAASGWLIGRLIDRHGARVPMAVAGVCAGGAMIALSFVDAGWQIVAVFAVVGLTGLQGGGGTLYSAVPLARWFVRLRGRAMSLAFAGTPVGIFVFAPLSQALIDAMGWRATWRILGGGAGLVTVLVALMVVRRRPEDMGLQPDGLAGPGSDEVSGGPLLPRVQAEYSWTRQEALRSSIFWRLALVDGLRMFAMSSMGVFRVPFFIDDKGFDAQLVAFALSAEALFAFVVALPAGWALDRFQPRFVAAASTLAIAIGFLLTMSVGSIVQVYASTSVFGLGVAVFIVSQNAMWPAYFGNQHIGSIRGLSMPVTLAFSAIGAPLTGIVRDEAGTYTPAWAVGFAGLLIGLLLLLVTPKPGRPRTVGVEEAVADFSRR